MNRIGMLLGLPSGVRIHNIRGNQPDIALLHNEHTGPSDGVIFIASCREMAGVTTHGGSVTIATTDLELGWVGTSTNYILQYLSAP